MYGSLQHIRTCSRPNISFSLIRIGYFQPYPNKFAFKCLKQVIRYLASFLNRPIFLKRIVLDKNTIILEASFGSIGQHPENTFGITLETLADFSHGNNPLDRTYFGGFLHTIGGTLVDWKVFKSIFRFPNTTDAELWALY